MHHAVCTGGKRKLPLLEHKQASSLSCTPWLRHMQEGAETYSLPIILQTILVIEVVASFPEDLAQIINEGATLNNGFSMQMKQPSIGRRFHLGLS